MPPRGRKPKVLSVTLDHPPSLELLRDSYRTLKEFHDTVAEKARSSDSAPNGLSGSATVPIFYQLLENYRAVMDRELDHREATSELIVRFCHFFRYQLSCLYSLPLKNIFVALRSSEPVSSSPIIGLMSYIYSTKIKDCRARVSDGGNPNSENNTSLMVQSWENILAAFGDGIRLFINNSEYGPKLDQFQVLVGKVLYPFLGQVLGKHDSNRNQELSDHVKRSLLEAGEALSGGCAQNKEYIRDSNIFGPAILSHIIADHSDFITANIALQVAFAVAPPLKGEKLSRKNQKKYLDATRENWFKLIFPSEKFGISVQEECVSRLSSMSSKHFWTDIGEIQARLFEDDNSRAYALPIQSGTIENKQIQLNKIIVPILQSTVQFNRGSLTWCSLDLNLSDDSIKENAEITAEICYEAILETQLEGISRSGTPLPGCKELTLSIHLKSDSSFEGCAPMIRYAPLSSTHRATLVLKTESRNAATLLRVLKKRKIKFSHFNSYLELQNVNEDELEIAAIKSPMDFLQTEENVYRESSKISICKDVVCSLEAEALPDLSRGLPAVSNSRERVASVQRDASIHSSKGIVSSSVSMEKNRETRKGFVNQTGHKKISNEKFSPKVSCTDCDDAPGVEHKFHQLKRPCRTWEEKGIIQSPQILASPASLSERLSESQHAATLGVLKPPEPNPRIPSPLNRPMSLKTTWKEPFDLVSEQESGENVKLMLRGKSWKTLVQKNIQKSPRRLKILREKTQKPSLTENSKLTDAESTDSIDDADEEITEIRKTDINFSDNSDEEDVIIEDLSGKESSGSSKKSVVLDKDIKPSGTKENQFNRPVVSTILESLGFSGAKKGSDSFKNDRITSSMDSEELESDFNNGGTIQTFHQPGKPENANRKKESEETKRPNRFSSPESAIKLVADPKKRIQHNTSLGTFLGQMKFGKNVNEKSDNQQQAFKQIKKINGALTLKSSRKRKLDLEPKNMAQQNERLGTFTGQSIHDRVAALPKTPVMDSTNNTSKPPLPSTSLYVITNDLTNSHRGDPTKAMRGRADRRQIAAKNEDTSEGLSTPLSRNPLVNFKAEVESPVFKYCEDDMREKYRISHKNKEKKLRFESPHPLIGSISAKRKAHQSEIFPPPPEDSTAGQEELPHSIKRRKLNPEFLQSSKDPLKSALKTAAPSFPTKAFNFDHLEMNPGKKMLQRSPNLELKEAIPGVFHQKSSLIEKLSYPKKNSTAKSPLNHDSRPPEDVFDVGNWRKKIQSKPSKSLSEKGEAANAQSAFGKKKIESSKNEESLSSCMDQLTQLVMTGIRDRKVKIEGIAVNTRMGVFNLTNNLVKDFDQQNEEILETVSQHALQRQNEYQEYYDQVVHYRNKTDQDLEWIIKYRSECKRQGELVS